MAWPTTTYNDVEYWLFDGITLIPVDPTTGAAIIMLKPGSAAITSGVPAIADGEPGDPALFQEGPITFTELAHDDPTAASLSIVEVSPGLYTIEGALHKGAPGDDGDTVLDIGDFTSPVSDQYIAVNAAVDGFELQSPRVCEVIRTGTLNNTAAGNTTSTLGTASIPSRPYDRKVIPFGYTIVTQNGGSSVVVDFYARLNGETSGNIVGICQGIGGTERLILSPTSVANANDAFDKVLANNAATVHFRTEQQSGINSYTTSNSTTRAGVLVVPV